jgi:hypothetical protein
MFSKVMFVLHHDQSGLEQLFFIDVPENRVDHSENACLKRLTMKKPDDEGLSSSGPKA